MDKWAELRTAYQVAKLGTVSAAAEVLGIHRATVNRHIDILEDELGARVFIRHAKGYTLTELGEDVLKVARQTESLVNDLAGKVQGKNARIEGEIKLTILMPFARLIMQPVAEFRRQNPHCRVCVIATESLAKLEYGEAHVALRAGTRPDNPDYIVREFMRVKFNLYAHESYVQRHGLPSGPGDLDGHHFALLDSKDSRLPFTSWVDSHVEPEQVALRCSDLQVGYAAIEAGLGIGFMTDLDVADNPDYHRFLPDDDDWAISVWQVTHVDLHLTDKVQALLACIRDKLELIGDQSL